MYYIQNRLQFWSYVLHKVIKLPYYRYFNYERVYYTEAYCTLSQTKMKLLVQQNLLPVLLLQINEIYNHICS